MAGQQPGAAGPEPVGAVLEAVLQQGGLKSLALLMQLSKHWQTIAGPQLATVSHPVRVQTAVLFVAVADAIWLQQFTFYQAQLLRNIYRVLGNVPIAKLHFVLATAGQRQVTDEPTAAQGHTALTAEEEEQIEEATAAIGDTELREMARRVWRRGWQVRR